MKYFDLTEDMSSRMRWRWHVGAVLLPDGSEPRLHAGLKLNDTRPLRADVTHAGRVLEFCLTSFAVPIATKALADAVCSIATSDVQCLPVAIGDQAGMFALNSIRLIRCLNEQHSEFIKWTEEDRVPEKTGQYRQVTRLVLGREAIPQDAHFFRVDGWRIALIVSEAVKDAMVRVGCYGAAFTELEMA